MIALAIGLAITCLVVGWWPTVASAAVTPAGGVYWGASIDNPGWGGQAPWSTSAMSDFESTDAGGKGISVVNFGQPFYDTADCNGGYCSFAPDPMNNAVANGTIPMVTWGSQDLQDQTDPSFSDSSIVDGSQDSYITEWAESAKAWGHPFFLRLDDEMNGSWYAWGVGANGNTAADFVAMWRHVHDIFTSVGATNVTWVWCPNVDPSNVMAPLASLYPGSAYVDWTCLDGYNEDDPWTSFQDLFSSTYTTITNIAPGKPVMIGETASTESGGSKASWISAMFTSLLVQFPQVHALLWWDASTTANGHSDWPIESSSSSISAFKSGISSPRFLPNDYGEYSALASPIEVPAEPDGIP